ncbi:MAG: orotidine-5'-phosphate decarboxylase [Thiotrichales bacterium]
MSAQSPVIVALDFAAESDALDLIERLDPTQCRVKVGFESFVAFGPQFVERIQHRGFDVFLDLKFHDIPNTVAGACRSAASLGVWMLTTHASGGQRMIAAARDALDTASRAPLLVAVTVLTSMDERDLKQVGIETSAPRHVANLATLAKQSGADGVVCSAQEASSLRGALGSDFVLVTPGIRMTESKANTDDQRRVMTPRAAIESGSSFLVIGRPITQAPEPMSVLSEILNSLDR